MIKFNGEKWYKAPPLYKRIRKWFIWVGGWELANSKGWRFSIVDYLPKCHITEQQLSHLNNLRTQDERDSYLKTIPYKKHRLWLSPTPISLFGHRITFYGWGMNISVKTGWLVIAWRKNDKRCYISPNGTPSEAHTWYWGTPKDILSNIN